MPNSRLLESLEKRGFVVLASPKKYLKCLTVIQLKDILKKKGLSLKGLKQDLIIRISDSFSDEELESMGCKKTYHLTELGRQELFDNEYVRCMRTLCKDMSSSTFNVWTINNALDQFNKSGWRDEILKQHCEKS